MKISRIECTWPMMHKVKQKVFKKKIRGKRAKKSSPLWFFVLKVDCKRQSKIALSNRNDESIKLDSFIDCKK